MLTRIVCSIVMRAESKGSPATRSAPSRYMVALLAVVLAVLLKLLLDPFIIQATPFRLVLAAVVVGAWYGGLGSGLAATAVAAVAVDYLFLPPINSFSSPGLEALPVSLFLGEGVLISAVIAALHSARERSEISARGAKARQEELQQSEERYQAVVEQAAENIFLADVETGCILQTNTALRRSLGYGDGELERMTIYEVVAHDRASIDANARQIIEEGHRYLGERRYLRKDGSLVDLEVGVSKIPYGDGEAMCIVAHDITERKRTESKLRQSLDSLVALYEAGQIFGASLRREEVGAKSLEIVERVSEPVAAILTLRDDRGGWRVWLTTGPEDSWRQAREEPESRAARHEVIREQERRSFGLRSPGTAESPIEGLPPRGLHLPLFARARLIGILEIYGSESLSRKETVETLASLANQTASALESARLYEELTEREQRLEELVGRLLAAQEEERRRVAYEIHDGLTQSMVAAYQYLQNFADDHTPASDRGRDDLEEVIGLVRQTVAEARGVIADLRPTILDDLGLSAAISHQLERLISEGWVVEYEERLGQERLPAAAEVAMFRIAQEALTNARKHSGGLRARVILRCLNGAVRLRVRDWGAGFRTIDAMNEVCPNGAGAGEKVGLSSMRERALLLGGNLEVHSKLGAGTLVVAEMPLGVNAESRT
ncbi:hypothetical protein BH20ACT11_BH20ACT11_02110 [soil metagenome]